MSYAVVYEGNSIVDSGDWVAGKHWTKDYPDQSVTIISYDTRNEETYKHTDTQYFIEYDNEDNIDYDSREKIDHAEIRRLALLDEKTICPTCHNEEATRGELTWVTDFYGNPYKKCCNKCYEITNNEIKDWRLDPTYAGESL